MSDHAEPDDPDEEWRDALAEFHRWFDTVPAAPVVHIRPVTNIDPREVADYL